MRIRHLVARDNVDGESAAVIDPRQIRHGILVGGRVADLAGLIDPITHLNLDFPEHRADQCVIVDALTVGAPVLFDEDSFAFAFVQPSDYRRLGRVDVTGRALAWHSAFAAHQKGAITSDESL